MKFTHCSLSIMEEITIECWRYFSNVKAQVPLFLLVVERLKEFSRYEFTSTFSLHTFGERKRGHLILYIHATCLKVLEDLDIPKELRDMFISIPEETFRMDISSTEIRKSQGLWFIKYGHTLLFYSRFEMILHNYRRYIWMFANNLCDV